MKTKKSIELKRFDNFDQNSTEIITKKFYNYAPSKTLNNSIGIRSALFPKNKINMSEKELEISKSNVTQIEGITFFKQYFAEDKKDIYRLLIYASDKKVYINQLLDDMYDIYWLYDLTFETAPQVLSYKKDGEDAVLLASDEMMKVWRSGYSPYTLSDVPIITSMCVNEGVLFCTIKDPAFKIWYATDLNAEKIGNITSSSDFISLEDSLGDARKVVAFNEEVFVFRDYGITKITLMKKEVLVSQVYSSNTKIYANTVSVCGNFILFMTQDGLYSFNGVKVSKTCVDLLSNLPIENLGAYASSLGDKYYLALRTDFEDGKLILNEEGCVNNTLVVVNINDFSHEVIRGVDVKALLPVKTDYFEKMLLIFNSGPIDKIGEIYNESQFMNQNLPKYWASEKLTESTRTKLLTKLSVRCDKDVKFSLVCDDKKFDFVSYKEGCCDFIFKIMCKDIRLEISSEQASAVVENVVLDYYEY